MKNKSVIKLLFLTLVVITLSSCEKEYTDTKDYGEKVLAANAKNDSVNLYNTEYDTTIVGTDTTITSKKVFYKRAALHVLSNGIQYAVYYDNSYGQYPQTETITYVKMNYTASYINGTSFLSGTNTIFTYSNLVTGLQDAVRRMKTGSKWRIWLPYSLAYGSSGSKNSDGSYLVDPYSALIYDVELLVATE